VLAVWKIEGEASNDSGGGVMTVFALAPGCMPPDPQAALDEATDGRYSWYRIDRMECVGEVPAAWDGRCPVGDWSEKLGGLLK
jgi:hypothetical protein